MQCGTAFIIAAGLAKVLRHEQEIVEEACEESVRWNASVYHTNQVPTHFENGSQLLKNSGRKQTEHILSTTKGFSCSQLSPAKQLSLLASME